MNLFDLFDDDGLSVYAETFADEKEEKKKVTKKEPTKKDTKNSDKVAKNSVKLPSRFSFRQGKKSPRSILKTMSTI